jgi:hypothetical protein
MEETFEIGEIVWVKLKGYPWWPGMVRQKFIIINLDVYISYIDKKNYLRTRIYNQIFRGIIRMQSKYK